MLLLLLMVNPRLLSTDCIIIVHCVKRPTQPSETTICSCMSIMQQKTQDMHCAYAMGKHSSR